MRRSNAILALSLLAGCVEYNVKGEPEYVPPPQITVDPVRVDFGAVDFGVEQAAVITLGNIGGEALNLEGFTLLADGAFTLSTEGTSTLLESGEETELLVTYTPWDINDIGALAVRSDDPDTPELSVPLTGSLDEPFLEFSPDPLDFGSYALGNSEDLDLTMRNDGAATLIVTDLMLSGDDVFSAVLPELPVTLEPGESTSWPVTFTPTALTEYSGRIWASSNAGTGSDSVALSGEGVSSPIAVCSVDPDEVYAHSEQPTWIGDESYDPSGARIVDYNWELMVRPEGSAAVMPSGTANRYDFAWDLMGTYVGKLTVTNEFGVESVPCTTVLTATTSDALWVEMWWGHNHDDMDLHLLAPGGSKNSTLDCHWSNCTGAGLDWGARGDSSDNPSLDLDDIPGTGPENIRIEAPYDGTYTVMVQDYPNTSYRSANSVTVNIYIGAVLMWTDTRDMEGEGEWETFATVSFPDGTVSGS